MHFPDKLDRLGIYCVLLLPFAIACSWLKKHWSLKHVGFTKMRAYDETWGHGPRRKLKKTEIFFERCWVCSKAKIFRLWCYTAHGCFHFDVYLWSSGGPIK